MTDIETLDVLRAYGAYEVYRRITNSPRNENTARRFYKFLGAHEVASGNERSFQKQWEQVVSLEQARIRVDWLLGPNAELLFKVWQAQNEHE